MIDAKVVFFIIIIAGVARVFSRSLGYNITCLNKHFYSFECFRVQSCNPLEVFANELTRSRDRSRNMRENRSRSGNMSGIQSGSIRRGLRSKNKRVATLSKSSQKINSQLIITRVDKQKVLMRFAMKVKAWSYFNSQVGSGKRNYVFLNELTNMLDLEFLEL